MIGFIGGGKMAEALIKGIIQNSRFMIQNIIVSEPVEERRKYLEQTYGVITTGSNREVASTCNVIILAIKPQNMESVVTEVEDLITEEKTVVSIAAGITLSYLQSKLKTKKLIRVMPNVAATLQEAMSVMSICECFSDKDFSAVKDIFMSIGKVLILPEKYMDIVTALSGSGPAFIAFFVEAMIEAGEKMGLSKDSASELVLQTFIGTTKLLEAGITPIRLREMVTSPGGTTEAAIKTFEEKGFKDIVYSALYSAEKRAKELGRS